MAILLISTPPYILYNENVQPHYKKKNIESRYFKEKKTFRHFLLLHTKMNIHCLIFNFYYSAKEFSKENNIPL